MTVYDLDSDASGEYVERLTVPAYEYFKTPLRAASGATVSSTISVDVISRTFTGAPSPSVDDLADAPTDPSMLTNDQASKGV